MSLEKLLQTENSIPGRKVKVIGEATTRSAKQEVVDLLFSVDDYVGIERQMKDLEEKGEADRK